MQRLAKGNVCSFSCCWALTGFIRIQLFSISGPCLLLGSLHSSISCGGSPTFLGSYIFWLTSTDARTKFFSKSLRKSLMQSMDWLNHTPRPPFIAVHGGSSALMGQARVTCPPGQCGWMGKRECGSPQNPRPHHCWVEWANCTAVPGKVGATENTRLCPFQPSPANLMPSSLSELDRSLPLWFCITHSSI